MATSVGALQLESYLTPWRKCEIKRRTGDSYESSWLDVSDYVTSWPKISFKTDVLRPFSYRIGSANMSFRSDEKQFSKESYGGSLFSSYLTRYRTLVRISTGLEDDDGVRYPTSDDTMFYGLMSHEISDDILETHVPIANISVVLTEFDALQIASEVTSELIVETAGEGANLDTASFTAYTISITGDNLNISGNTVSTTGITVDLTGTYNSSGNTLSVTTGWTMSFTTGHIKRPTNTTLIIYSYTPSQSGYTLSSTNQTMSTTGGGPGFKKENGTGTSFLDFRGHTMQFNAGASPTYQGEYDGGGDSDYNYTLSTTDYTMSFTCEDLAGGDPPLSYNASLLTLSCTKAIISLTGDLVNTHTTILSISSQALTSQEIIEKIRDYQDSSGNVVLDQFLSSGAWSLNNTGRLYIIPNEDYLRGKTAFSLIEELAIAENYVFYIDRLSNVVFEQRDPANSSVYNFYGTGLGVRNTNIEAFENYSEGIDKIYTKFTIDLGNSTTVSTQESLQVGVGSSSWKYGQREYSFKNILVNSDTAGDIVSDLLDYFVNERDELTIRTKFIAPNLDINNVVTVKHLGESGGDESQWDLCSWDLNLWSDERGGITIDNVDFYIVGIEQDLQNWFSRYYLKEKK